VTDTKSIEYKHTQCAQCRKIKTNTTERLTANLEVERRNCLTKNSKSTQT